MKITDHIQKLSKVLIYAAPDIPIIPPGSLPNGFENIEIMLSGEMFYPIDSKLQRFGRGTIFWHQAGEFDIWQNTSVENSYRCVCFTFETSRRARPVPSIGHWHGYDAVAPYYDACNFASYITVPVFMSIGYLDKIAPPAGGYAAFNQLQGPKELMPMYNRGHEIPKEYHVKSEAFFKQQLK